MSISTRSRSRILVAAIAGLGLAIMPALSASAATPSITNGTATLSATHANLSAGSGYTTVTGTSAITVAVDGSGYSGVSASFVPVGVYAVYGPKEADFATNSGWYGDAEYVTYSTISAGGGDFSTSLTISPSYTANPHHEDTPKTVSCEYDYALTYVANLDLDQYKCYIQTFTAHGLPLNSDDELALEVRW